MFILMKERCRPQPENPKPHAPEAGAGPLGKPPPGSEQSPQYGGSKSPEPQPVRGEGSPFIAAIQEKIEALRKEHPRVVREKKSQHGRPTEPKALYDCS
jgi:hypothetical protein